MAKNAALAVETNQTECETCTGIRGQIQALIELGEDTNHRLKVLEQQSADIQGAIEAWRTVSYTKKGLQFAGKLLVFAGSCYGAFALLGHIFKS